MRSFIRFLSRRAPRRAPSRPPHRFRPQLEGLSLRIVPSNNFTGASGGSWGNAANWTDGVGSHHVPTTTEDVQVMSKTVDVGNVSITVGSLAMVGSTLNNCGGGFTVANGGGFSGSTIALNGGTFEVAGGTLSLNGSITLSSYGSLFVVDAGATVDLGSAIEMYGDIENYGTIETTASASCINFHVDDTHSSNLYNDADGQILFNTSCSVNSSRGNGYPSGGSKLTITNNGLMRSQNDNWAPTVHLYGDVTNNGSYLVHDGDNYFEGTVTGTDYSFRNTSSGTLTLYTAEGTGAGSRTSVYFRNGHDVATGSSAGSQNMSLYNAGLFKIVNRDAASASVHTAYVDGGVECDGGTIRFDATGGKVLVTQDGDNSTGSTGYGRSAYLHGGAHFEVNVNFTATKCDQWSQIFSDSYFVIKTGDSDVLKVTETGTRNTSVVYSVIHTSGAVYGDFDTFDVTYWGTHHHKTTYDLILDP